VTAADTGAAEDDGAARRVPFGREMDMLSRMGSSCVWLNSLVERVPRNRSGRQRVESRDCSEAVEQAMMQRE
jgi:hypothetical protein